jgi:flagellar protein FliL
MFSNPLFFKVIYAINLLGLLIGVGAFFYAVFLFEKPLPNDQSELQSLKGQARVIPKTEYIKLKKMAINLYSRNSKLKFLEIEIQILPLKKSYSKVIKDNIYYLQDIIIDIAGNMNPNELNTLTGKILLEEKIKNRFNKKRGKPMIKKIFYTWYVIQ